LIHGLGVERARAGHERTRATHSSH
jgi:hypothetical protein